MAYGTEVILGWSMEHYPRVWEALGIKLAVPNGEVLWEQNDDGDRILVPDEQAALLKEAQLEALTAVGFTVLGIAQNSRYTAVRTPLGDREFSPFWFELHYDPDEMHEKPEHSTFGVSISGRYFPKYLDWEDENGTLFPVRLDEKMLDMIAVVREKLEAKFPIFRTASIVVIEKHY